MTNEKVQRHAVLEEYPQISQELRLTCCRCRKSAVYDVGTVLYDREGQDDAAEHHYSFTTYFRCRDCESAGPWEIADFVKILSLLTRAKADREFQGLRKGRCALFDGTVIQTPAMGEERLLELIRQDPANAFLCCRLGNVLRNCGEKSKALPWYEKAIELDPGDIEARYELFCSRIEVQDVATSLSHALELVAHLLSGRKTENEDLNNDIALSVVEDLRTRSELFRRQLLAEPARDSASNEVVFVRTLLDLDGDEQDIVRDGAARLLSGKPKPAEQNAVEEKAILVLDLVSSLRTVVETAGLNPNRLTVALESNPHGARVRVVDRHIIPVSDGAKMAGWNVASVRELFRGSQLPPSDIDHYPAPYGLHFHFIENHFLTVCDAIGDRSDQEMEEIYATLRRRPDGRSLGAVHDFLWQVAALLLGSYALSAAEYEALFGQLARSTRKWAVSPISRNYVAYLRQTFDETTHPESVADGASYTLGPPNGQSASPPTLPRSRRETSRPVRCSLPKR